ncbi:hypothetical protein PHYPSEUDO_010955 [Phytophthora pseudosyringae]|uniref:ERCC4 domain-containing protein n=1 Tax=Phytophthora pseudosyringae TaxID=221518 RepID=A0A8T1WAS6_9STRA|nr:hypothetical protein PHYPSEUDO_010955 [Phytophthora pseudosyringae]
MECTPSPSARARKRRRTRPRDSLEDEDDGALDAMLTELGIPSSGHRGAPNRSPSACVEVIELITPSPKKKQSDGPSSSVVDLTTSPSSPRPSPSTSHGYINTVQQVAVAVAVDDEHEEEDEISFSYDPSESPPPFAYSLPAQAQAPAQAAASDDDEPEVLSPEMTTTARRRVFPEKSKQTGARQARRLSGHLKDLHSETTRASGGAGKRRETTTVAAVGEVAGAVRTATGASPCRSRTGGRATAGVIALVQMEKSLDTSAAGDGIREALKSHVYNGKPVPYSVATALNCIIPGVIRWERKGCGESHYSCAIYYEAGVFLEMIQKKGYKELVAAVRYIQSLVPKARKAQNEEESNKLFVVIQGMDRALIELKKQQKKKKTGPSASSPMLTFADLQEVAFQLFMDMGVHTKFTCDLEATANYVALLTRELVAASSRATALEEFLESVPRYNSFRVTHSGGTASVCANAWLRMLLVIPGVSEDKAQCLLNHFPTFDSLMCVYRDPKLSRAQKEDLVADKLHDARIQRALSKKIYSVFCEENPDALI